ncbi:LLM class flavin-dependent oxidoreductase [Paenibacillus polymyxa]|uniref:LLM class flavin-dependent oxidoreductase n=1 Tax=Paenibacillus polymyxa TaxID=1406 RepID=UPI0025B6EF43|nr:LLM class flavin-dependent oxidoreductase [Paenibacillus polymyxa]MDN4080992.1 LLM class flavin-dependent oxidoreductase [Paenibacillus polymyxa]MDN4106620.1 LLM class flavin-dependent oxidoreductase [Paenibacillus polymyxa]MDN4116632.1 LLM class flavin-dependent oxidoreductase [Paenibacillus polymyxa]
MKYQFEVFCNVSNINYSQSSQYINQVQQIITTAEKYNYDGSLFHFNHLMVDPFILASNILQHTNNFVPIIAALPSYNSPVATVKKVQSLTYIYGKKVNLNMITGAAKHELEQISDLLEHPSRYQRLQEYIEVVKLLLESDEPIDYKGTYYNYNKLHLGTPVPKHLMPDIYVAGSSDAAIQLAGKLAQVAMTHPGPIEHFKQNFLSKINHPSLKVGIEIGIITRKTSAEAWEVARQLYPQSFLGMLHTKVKLNSESTWLRQMAELGLSSETHDDVFWMGAFTSGGQNNPLLVGSYEDVAAYFEKYLQLGVNVIILTELRSADEFEHVDQVMKLVRS